MTNNKQVYINSKDKREIDLEMIIFSIFSSNRSVSDKQKILDDQLKHFSNEIDNEINKEREFYNSNRRDLKHSEHVYNINKRMKVGLSSLVWYISLYKHNEKISREKLENLIQEKEHIKTVISNLKEMIR